MARYSFNSDDLNSENSLIIEGIPVAENPPDRQLVLFGLGDLNADGNDDIYIHPSLTPSLDETTFFVFGNETSPDTLNLADLDGSNGFSINGLPSVFDLSDINGDGFPDAISNYFAGTDIEPITMTKAFFGRSEFPATVDATTLDGNNGFNISDDGNPVVAFPVIDGDINNDNIDDFFLLTTATPEDNSPTVNTVIFGRSDYPAELDISNIDGSNGFNVTTSVSAGIGTVDVNGDDVDDLIFSSNDENFTNYVVFGRSQFPAELDLDSLASGEGFTITQQGANTDDSPTEAVTGTLVEDINGDGIGDIIFGKTQIPDPNSEDEQSGEVFVIYGSSENTATNFDVANIDGSNGFTIDSEIKFVSTIDLNGDNRQDLLVESFVDEKTYVIFGSDNIPANLNLNSLDGTNGFVFDDDDLNATGGGDINGDGIDDLFLNDNTVDDNEDDDDVDYYILLGSQEPFPATVDLDDPNTNALEISGDRTDDGVGFGLFDMNGDGADEIIFNATPNEEDNTISSAAILFGDSELSFATDNSGEEPDPDPDPDPDDDDDLLETDIFRFQNSDIPGTYLYVAAEEAQNIRDNFSNFVEEGLAFEVAVEPRDELIALYRFQSTVTPGTYIFVGASERADINENFAEEFTEEGLAFYVYGAGTNQGTPFSRFQNNSLPGTYLFAGPEESANIEADFPNFQNEGIAFEVDT